MAAKSCTNSDDFDVLMKLREMINDPQVQHDEITRQDVYSDLPVTITADKIRGRGDSQIFLSPRHQVGKRIVRKVAGGQGTWTVSGQKVGILDPNLRLVGYKTRYYLYLGNLRVGLRATYWLMTEYSLVPTNLQTMCKIQWFGGGVPE